MKTKKGILLSNTLSVVIAVLGLLLIFFAAYKLYDNAKNSDLKSAQTTLDTIEAKINAIELNKPINVPIQGFNEEWYLTGWSKDHPNPPDKCFFKSCICVCSGENRKDACQSNGFCRDISEEEFDVLIPSLTAKFEEGKQYTVECYKEAISPIDKQIPLPNKFIEIEIEKTESKLTFTYLTENYLANKWQKCK
jgi:hypothetical protein